MSNCKVIALTNQKGGVGKTTTAVNLGVSLVQQGKKVLLIDADAQANLTMALGYNRPDDIPITLSTVMQNIIDDKTLDASQGIIHHREGVDLLPSNIELSGFEVRLINAMSRERVLKTYVNEVKKNYDYVLIDCMPSLGMITINALAAADSVIIPTQPHYLSAKGLELLLRSVSMVKRQINPKLRIDGILMTMVMPRTNISKSTYGSIYIISCIFNVFNVTMNNIVTSEGAAKTTMCALLIGAVLNIALDPIFIYVLDLGVAGAAIATAISQVVSTLVYLFYILGKKSVFDFKIKNYCLSKEIASEIFKIGIPTLVFQILTSLSISLINNAAADYGDAAIAGMGVVTRLVSMGSLTIFGFIKGFQPIAGYSYGAKKFNRLHEAIKTSIIWSTIFCVVYGLILALFSTSIVSQFASGNLEMIKVGASSLRVNGISLMLFGFYTVYSSLFLALGKGKEGFILGACRQGICFVPVILVLPMIWGLNGILYAQPVADVLSAIITVFMAIHLHRELNEAEKQAAIARTNEVH